MTLTRKEAKTAKTANLPKWRSLDPVLLLVSLALSAFGILAVYVASTVYQQANATNQALGFVLGVVGAVPLALIDYRIWQRYLRPIYGLVILMLLAAVAWSCGRRRPAVGGHRTCAGAAFRVRQAGHGRGSGRVFRREGRRRIHGLPQSPRRTLVPALLVFMQPDLGTALVFGAVFVAMAYIAGARMVQLAGLVAAAVAAAVLAVKLKVLEDYQVARLTAFMNPDGTSDVGYQVAQSKMAIGSGGITGKGLDAQTLANLGFLPEDHTDFIFSNLAERVGFVGSIVLIALFFLLVWRILHVATISRDRFGV